MTTENAKTVVPLGHFIIARGWYYHELAKLLNMRPSTLGDIASGRRWPQLMTRKAIAKALGVTMDALVDMLEASAELQLTGETGQQFSRSVADMRRLARRIKQPAAITIVEARAGRASLLSLIRRRRKTVIVVARRRSA